MGDPSSVQAPSYNHPWDKILSSGHPLLVIFQSLNTAISHTQLDQSHDDKWSFIEYWIDPIIHRLLSIDPPSEADITTALLYEMCRLGICVFVGSIRRNCGKLGASTKVYVKKLKELLSHPGNANVVMVPRMFILWILFFGMLESVGLDEEEWFLAC